MATTSRKEPADWAWVSIKRTMLPQDELFCDGNAMCGQGQSLTHSATTVETEDQRCKTLPCQIASCDKVFDSLASFEAHYNSSHRHACGSCKKVLPSSFLLEIHILEWHDALFQLQAAKQNMYRCLVESCLLTFKTPQLRKEHMIKHHRYPANFRFDPHPHKNTKKKEKISKSTKHSNVKATLAMETDDSQEMEINRLDPVPSESSSSDVSIKSEQSMEATSGPPMGEASSKPIKYSYTVPKHISFGHGCKRSFNAARRRGKAKHWHQTQSDSMDTSVQIEDVPLDDLLTAITSDGNG